MRIRVTQGYFTNIKVNMAIKSLDSILLDSGHPEGLWYAYVNILEDYDQMKTIKFDPRMYFSQEYRIQKPSPINIIPRK